VLPPPLSEVKQGCPLRPTFFGILLDGLNRYIAVHCLHLGPSLSDGTLLSILHYADDVTLLACDPTHLQTLIDYAIAFCKAVKLRSSPAKTSFLTFPGDCPPIVWSCDNQPVQCVPSATSLGLDFHSAHGLLSTCASREKKMWGAWAALQRQYAGLHCGVSLSLLFRVHQACVPPVGSYGCELWGFRSCPVVKLRLGIS
jgi:hypothetical protein